MDFSEKRVLVTGGCGTVGSELVRQLLEEYKVAELTAIDNNESELFFLEQRFSHYPNANFFLADIRDQHKISRKMKGRDLVFHAAAFKHVILCERSPFEAVQTNILGVQNLIQSVIENNVEKFIFTSSDKAVNPTNVMGTSKLMGEKIVSAANSDLKKDGPALASTRFGNVLGSRGSVIPIFREQIRKGGPITLTSPEMTRFIMSISQAVRLIIDSMTCCMGGEVFVTKMPVIRIKDLAEVMIEELAPVYGHRPEDVPIEIIGAKPGEKMYEELMSLEETRRAWELEKYFVIRPAFTFTYRDIHYDYPGIVSKEVHNPYNSSIETPISKKELKMFLNEYKLLAEDESQARHPAQRYWPDPA